MNRRPLAASILVLAAACSQPTTNASQTSTTVRRANPSTTTERRKIPVSQDGLDAIAERYRSACKSPGAAVGLRDTDGSTHFAVSGQFAPGVALDVNSQFLAGSVTKLFVATVAYQLIVAHKLSLDDKVSEYIPGWPRGNQITVRMLLGHRSG